MIVKAIIILLIACIFFALGSALYFLVHDEAGSDRIVKALTWRIGLSLLVFVLLLFAFFMGWISPHQI
ncbi:MAG: twin transmembrane helix small protein [Gammaproteobacteria bacterium]|nr:twin transmembrane helix small protein [Gammaproteobacteria bacterium]